MCRWVVAEEGEVEEVCLVRFLHTFMFICASKTDLMIFSFLQEVVEVVGELPPRRRRRRKKRVRRHRRLLICSVVAMVVTTKHDNMLH